MLTLFTDSDTDMTPELCEEYGYHLISMPYTIEGKEIFPYIDFDEFDYKAFYSRLRSGVIPKTSAINPYDYVQYFENELRKGNDILYVHFSRAMSGTFNALNIAIEELKEMFPERTIYLIDTKAISICSMAIVREIGKMYKEGKSIEELLAYGEEATRTWAIYFFANDLKFFQRSGRVSGLSAFFGTLIGIHPIIYIGDDGKMTNLTTVRGKLPAMRKLINYVDELGDDIKNHKIYIAHADALELAEQLKAMLVEKYGNDLDIEFVVVNPTIGSHCGPSSIGICFHAIHR